MKKLLAFSLVFTVMACGKQSGSSSAFRLAHNGSDDHAEKVPAAFDAINQYSGHYQVKSQVCQNSAGSTACDFGAVDSLQLGSDGKTFQFAMLKSGQVVIQNKWQESTTQINSSIVEKTWYDYDKVAKIAYYHEEEDEKKTITRTAKYGFRLIGSDLHFACLLWTKDASILWSRYEVVLQRLKQ